MNNIHYPHFQIHPQILHAIPRSELCESVLFGIPLIVVPTACWTIDWKELDQNQNNFNALCDELVKKVLFFKNIFSFSINSSVFSYSNDNFICLLDS